MFCSHSNVYAVISTICFLATLDSYVRGTKIVYSYPASGPHASSTSSSSQYGGVLKKRENLPGFDSGESYSPRGGSSDGGRAYSSSSFSGGEANGFSTVIKHDVPSKKGDREYPYHKPSPPDLKFNFPSSAERPEPSQLFSSYFSQNEPSPFSSHEEASETASGGKQLEEPSGFYDEENRPSPNGESTSFNEDDVQDRPSSDVGCKNCNYAHIQTTP